MTLTALDPRTALIVVDLQKGIVSHPTVHPIADILQRAAELTDAFRRRSQPVVLANVAGTATGRTEQPRRIGDFPEDFLQFAPELTLQASDHVVTSAPGAPSCTASVDRAYAQSRSRHGNGDGAAVCAVFHSGSREFGLLTSAMAIGSIAGALM